jgi:DNA ligase-1
MPLDHDGDVEYVQGSGSGPYELKNVGGVLSCSCPAWRNQSLDIARRTCKHLRSLRGDTAEAERVGASLPGAAKIHAVQAPTPAQGVGKPNGHSDAYKQGILDRAAAEGRKLRQDEKAKLNGPPVMLAHPLEESEEHVDPTGWLMSEKLDGVRAWWDGKDFVSRQGNAYPAPDWFKAGLPKDVILDGELWMGRKLFQKTISVVKTADFGDRWKQVSYVVYDVPAYKGVFEERIAYLGRWQEHGWHCKHARVLDQHRCEGMDHLRQELSRVTSLGGEGLIIKAAGSLYSAGRSWSMLKVKPFKDAEAVVVGYTNGKGRLKGMTGGLMVRLPDGKEFKVGTGLSDELRRSPPPVGAQITYRYTELTDGGVPKCASFVAVRDYE